MQEKNILKRKTKDDAKLLNATFELRTKNNWKVIRDKTKNKFKILVKYDETTDIKKVTKRDLRKIGNKQKWIDQKYLKLVFWR